MAKVGIEVAAINASTPLDAGRMIYNSLYLPFIAVTCTAVIRGQIDISRQL